ncbi:hypothetical protein DFJ73DRAFT_806105 [Zopfochytrium polystomum]|nr:hypothetical protein DFJ73DRAFT_806105 [Zopfochytrium polystomum]
MPSHGRWLRRRKNDGALNRVPSGFYPQVWRVLSRCHGILVGKQFLPRDPTVSEKTPEEFNFALQVESHLDAVRDPAERQIAFECLTVIARIAARHPDAAITSGTVDVLRVIRDAVGQFWTHWRARHSPADLAAASAVIFGSAAAPSAAGAQPSDLSFEANEGMARRLFFDLAPDGPDGTMAYLARSSAALCFSAGALGADAAEMEDLFRS